MLVLTRKLGETIKVGKNIEITIVGIKGQNIRVGVSAPDNIEIYRKELVDKSLTQQEIAIKKEVAAK